MKHFLESLQRRIDFRNEYEKLEDLVIGETKSRAYSDYESRLNRLIEDNFLKWGHRGSYTSLDEVRDQLGFSFEFDSYNHLQLSRNTIKMEDYFLYCEMIFNLVADLEYCIFGYIDNNYLKSIIDTMDYVIETCGYERKKVDGEIQIVQKNAVAFQVAEEEPNIEDAIIEYNHYLLKGNIDEKKNILRKIADALEPDRDTISSVNKKAADDFFYMVNNLNLRHNNVTPGDKNYKKAVAEMNSDELEKIYDMVYEQALLLFMQKSQIKRNERIKVLKDLLK